MLLAFYIAVFGVFCLILAGILSWLGSRQGSPAKKRAKQKEKFKSMTDKQIRDFIKRF
jgi:uncharacterized membrane protein